MDPLLVISNAGAGPARRGVAAGGRCRSSGLTPTSRCRRRPTRASSTARCTGRDRGGIVVAGGDAACTRWSAPSTVATTSRAPCSDPSAGHGQRLRPGPTRSPWTSRRPPRSSSTATPADGPGRGRGRRDRRQQRARGCRRAGRTPWRGSGRTGCTSIGVGKANLGKSWLPHWRGYRSGQTAVHPGGRRGRRRGRGRHGRADPDGRGRQRIRGRRRQRADHARRPGNGTVDVMVSRSIGPLARFGYAAMLAVGRTRSVTT